jgi:hypothetical protein
MPTFEEQIDEMRRWFELPRFKGIERLYTPREVVEQRGTIRNEYTVARDAAFAFHARLWEMFETRTCMTSFGPYSPGEAVAMKRMGIEGIYIGGWATSAKGSKDEDPGPDLASYPLSRVPDEAAGIVRALLAADRNDFHARARMTDEQRKDEIEKGFSAVKWALGASPSPLFRFPALQHPPTMVTYLGERNISMWSCDLDSFDFKSRTAQKIVDTVMSKLEKNGKGIILMHDFQKHTAEALPEIMKRLKAGGYKVVQVKAKAPMQTIAKYDEELVKDVKLPTVSSRPVNSVVQTISE